MGKDKIERNLRTLVLVIKVKNIFEAFWFWLNRDQKVLNLMDSTVVASSCQVDASLETN